MSNQSNIERILNSLDGIQRACPRPFFTARLLQRIQSSKEADSTFSWARLGWTFTFVFILIALNLILFFSSSRSMDQVISDWKSTTPDWVVDYTENPGMSIYDLPNNK